MGHDPKRNAVGSTPSRADASARSRYRQLLDRAMIDLKLAHDLALSMAVPYGRRARITRARREVNDELQEAERCQT